MPLRFRAEMTDAEGLGKQAGGPRDGHQRAEEIPQDQGQIAGKPIASVFHMTHYKQIHTYTHIQRVICVPGAQKRKY